MSSILRFHRTIRESSKNISPYGKEQEREAKLELKRLVDAQVVRKDHWPGSLPERFLQNSLWDTHMSREGKIGPWLTVHEREK